MSLGSGTEFSTVLKLVPSKFAMANYDGEGNLLLNFLENRVFIRFQSCEFCNKEFIGTEHDDPGKNPIELAVTYCGKCLET